MDKAAGHDVQSEGSSEKGETIFEKKLNNKEYEDLLEFILITVNTPYTTKTDDYG
jgi:hypothetical protein